MSTRRTRRTGFVFVTAFCMIIAPVLALLIAVPTPVRATATGDVYGGSGDWAITSPTIYTGETLTVYGNITITDGYLKLIGSTLTIDQPFALCRNITLNGWPGPTQPKLYVQSGSVIQSTNATSGYWNTYIKVTGYSTGIPQLAIDNSTLKNMYLHVILGDNSYVSNSTLIASGVWNNYGLEYELGEPYYSSIHFYNDTFRDVDVTGKARRNVIEVGTGMTIHHSTFQNITLDGSTDVSAIIKNNAQNNVSITYNYFASNCTQLMYAIGNVESGYPITNMVFSHNELADIGSNYTNRVNSIYLKNTGLNTEISYNHFHRIRNASVGILITGKNWTLNDNLFDYIDATGLTDLGLDSTRGIKLVEQGNGIVMDGTVINNMEGSHSYVGPAAIGITSYQAGNYTIRHSTFRNMTDGAAGISPLDNVGDFGPYRGNITIFANTFVNMVRLSNGIYFYGGGGGVVSWNNYTVLDGSATGIMLHDIHQAVLVHNNSVSDKVYGPNTGEFWQISVGAYSVCASNIWNATFRDNHASGTTAEWPSYDISQEKLGGGWWEHLEATIDVSEPTIIHTDGANLTLVHDNQVLQVERDGTPVSMTHYSNGTSRHYFAKADLLDHWINVSATQLSLTTTGDVNITVSASPGASLIAWNGTATAATVTFTLSGLTTGTTYKVYVDSVVMVTMAAVGGQVSFAYSAWSTHTFEVVLPTTYVPSDDTPQVPSEQNPSTSDPGTTSFSWTGPAVIVVVSCSVLIALLLLLRRPRGSSGHQHR